MGYALGCTSHEMLWLAVMGIGGAGVEETAGMAGVPPSTELLAPERRAQLLRRGLWLEYATLGWNVVEIGFLVAAAVAAQSVALAGFALDSFIEIFASLVVVGQLRGTATPDGERRALRRIGLAFFGIALYIAAQAVVTLISGVEPDSSALGIGWLAATCVVMFGLAAGKARTGDALGHPVLRAEAGVTVVDGALAAGILAGLVLNAVAGWWWADVAAGAILVVYGIREGRDHLWASH
jgi:divalent metal cation (Fe/Co/Zn/Cd) transporter